MKNEIMEGIGNNIVGSEEKNFKSNSTDSFGKATFQICRNRQFLARMMNETLKESWNECAEMVKKCAWNCKRERKQNESCSKQDQLQNKLVPENPRT